MQKRINVDTKLNSLRKSLRAELIANKLCGQVVHADNTSSALQSHRITMSKGELGQCLMETGESSNMVVNATVCRYHIAYKHLGVGVYTVWLEIA